MMDLANYPLPIIFLISLVVLLGASEIGRGLGARRAEPDGGDGDRNLSTLEAASLGLLALMISFTFGMSLSRFEARRDAVVEEANDIGTTALRARLLPSPHNTESLALLRQYVDLRVSALQHTPTEADLTAIIVKSEAIQESLWQQAKAAAAENNSVVPTGLFINTLNEMIDMQDTRLAVIRNKVPDVVLLALYGIAMVAVGFVGYCDRQERRPIRLPGYIMCATTAAVILLIQDLDRPRAGFVTIDQRPMLELAETLAHYSD